MGRQPKKPAAAPRPTEYGPDTGFRFARPEGAHKSFRFQRHDPPLPGWVTFKNEDIETLNKLFKAEVLSLSDAEKRAVALREGLYAERDRQYAQPTMMPGNLKILDTFLADKYPPATKRRMYNRSYISAYSLLKLGVECLGVLPIDGPVEPIQEHIDSTFEDRLDMHKKRTMAINRIRLWLGVRTLDHLVNEKGSVIYLTQDEVLKCLEGCPEPEKTIAAVAFFAGLRPSEIRGLEARDLKGDVLRVDRQPNVDGINGVSLPKLKKKRKAFVIDGGVPWVEAWLTMKDGMKTRHTPAIIKQYFGHHLYTLRHSYAVHLIGQGATLDWIAQSLGHSRETCERHYIDHVLSTDSIDMLRALKKVK